MRTYSYSDEQKAAEIAMGTAAVVALACVSFSIWFYHKIFHCMRTVEKSLPPMKEAAHRYLEQNPPTQEDDAK